jgi:hypothetical protein
LLYKDYSVEAQSRLAGRNQNPVKNVRFGALAGNALSVRLQRPLTCRWEVVAPPLGPEAVWDHRQRAPILKKTGQLICTASTALVGQLHAGIGDKMRKESDINGPGKGAA